MASWPADEVRCLRASSRSVSESRRCPRRFCSSSGSLFLSPRSWAPPSPPTQGSATREGVNDHVNDRLVIEQLVDLAKDWVPELVRVGQQHLEDTALRVRATDHGTSDIRGLCVRCRVSLSFHDHVRADHSSTKTCVRTL